MGLKLTTDRHPAITSQTRYPLRHAEKLKAACQDRCKRTQVESCLSRHLQANKSWKLLVKTGTSAHKLKAACQDRYKRTQVESCLSRPVQANTSLKLLVKTGASEHKFKAACQDKCKRNNKFKAACQDRCKRTQVESCLSRQVQANTKFDSHT